MSRGFWHAAGATRRTLRWTRWLILALLLPLLLLAAFGQWWLLPRLNDYRAPLADALRDALRTPVRIESVAADRDGWRLGLRLRGVSLRDPDSNAAWASFAQATVSLNLWRSLREWRPVFGHIRLEGVSLTLEQGPDGTLRLRTNGGSENTASSLKKAARWLFAARRLDLIGERLTVRRQDGGVLIIPHPYVRVRDTAEGQRLTFTAELPIGLGDRLRLSVERQGVDGADSEKTGQGTFRFEVGRLNLAGWPLSLPFGAGQVGLEVDGDWRDWQPTRLQGHLRLRAARPQPEPRTALLESWLAATPDSTLNFEWRIEENGWRLRGQVRFGGAQGQSEARSSFVLSRTGERWRGEGRDWRVRDVLAWVAPWLDESVRNRLTPLDPRGDLPEIALDAESGFDAYTATVRLSGVAGQPTHGLPGFDNLAGLLTFGPTNGRLELDSREVRIDTDGLLRVPLDLDRLSGTIAWQRNSDRLQLDSAGLEVANADLNGRFWGSVILPDQGEPVLDLGGRYWGVRIGPEQARRYLPVAVIPPAGIAWLDQAIISGRVVSGELALRGPPAQFPFDRDEGLFETRFRVEDAVVNYLPGWPRLEGLRGSVTFRNRGVRMEVEPGAGRLLDAKIENLAIWIDDLEKVVAQAKGRIDGSGASLWRGLKESPVGQDLGGDLPDLRITGQNTVDLELTVPTDSRPIRARGRVGLVDNSVSLPSRTLEFSRLKGEVEFTETNLKAEDMRALLRGEPVRIDLSLAGGEGQRELRGQLRGQIGLRTLTGAPAALDAYLEGKSLWQAVLTVPIGRRDRRNEASPFTLTLNSDLRGMAVRLPAPLGKDANEVRPFAATLHPLGHDALELALEYEMGVRAALELSGYPHNLRLERGELRVNAGAARLPDTPGLAIVADLSRWRLDLPAALSDSTDSITDADIEPKTMAWWSALRDIDARIGEFAIGDQSFTQLTLAATRRNGGLQVELEGEGLAGRLTVPDRPTPARPINAALRRLHWRRAAEDAASPTVAPDPRRLPPLVLTATEFRLDDKALGRLRVVAMPMASGVRLPEISLGSERQRIDASGEWRRTLDGQLARLQATLWSRALEETLAAFGYQNSGIAGGETEAELRAEWMGALPDLALERMDGHLKFRIGPGQLLNIDPGLGRVVGLFSVQNIMRRLTFDFSDLFQPGTSFDRITGEFAFKHGQAFTDNLTIEAPAARIDIQGRTGLRDRDYDQQITVTPKLGGALPVAGVLAGGPAVGAAVLVAERLLQKGIEHATRYRYTLTGSWDHPVLEPLQEPPPATASKKFAGDQ
ncbi:MAG: YhdP family protein [Candidatus Competibacter sp.]|nr:YhdP family protein [Candidatus Competibacter sp.]MDG4585795.1 YhdP family protein [Candidatus Competibacter sp.]